MAVKNVQESIRSIECKHNSFILKKKNEAIQFPFHHLSQNCKQYNPVKIMVFRPDVLNSKDTKILD